MAEPFVFCFRPDAHGHPEQMYIQDVLCGCGVCGHDQIQRFYHAMSFHTLTLERLLMLLATSNQVASYECEHCGSPVGPQEVRVGVTRFAFADDAGEVVAYASGFGLVDGPELAIQLFENRRLDPQVQPRFEPDPEVPVYEDLSREVLVQHLGRAMSIKRELWRMMLEWEHDEQAEEGLVSSERVSEDFWVVVGDPHEDLVGEAIAQNPALARDDERVELEWIELWESEPLGLATHARPETLSGRWPNWVSGAMYEALEDGQVEVWCGVSPHAAEQVLARAFEVARLGYERHLDEHGLVVFDSIRSPRDELYGEQVSVWSVLQRAVYTGISVGDAARLTAEEIVGVMLNVWKRASADQ